MLHLTCQSAAVLHLTCQSAAVLYLTCQTAILLHSLGKAKPQNQMAAN